MIKNNRLEIVKSLAKSITKKGNKFIINTGKISLECDYVRFDYDIKLSTN